MAVKYEVKGDQWYNWKGVKPPERQPHMTEDEIDEALANNLKGHKCDWRQNGAEILCDIGMSVHGKHIGPKVRLDGTNENGTPILVPFGPILRT